MKRFAEIFEFLQQKSLFPFYCHIRARNNEPAIFRHLHTHIFVKICIIFKEEHAMNIKTAKCVIHYNRLLQLNYFVASTFRASGFKQILDDCCVPLKESYLRKRGSKWIRNYTAEGEPVPLMWTQTCKNYHCLLSLGSLIARIKCVKAIYSF